MENLITNAEWAKIYKDFIGSCYCCFSGYYEALNFSFSFHPQTSSKMSNFKALFDNKKAAKMFFWYKKADKYDKSIIDYFPEYAHCIDNGHTHFNSNYGLYAYAEGGLKYCVDELLANPGSRRACFCINSNKVATNNSEIDKLCTNTIHFFIRNATLQMVVQMRSSNFLTLLPYDAFMFSIFYFQVYKALNNTYKILIPGEIHMQIASLHYYNSDYNDIMIKSKCRQEYQSDINFIDFSGSFDDIVNKLNKELK